MNRVSHHSQTRFLSRALGLAAGIVACLALTAFWVQRNPAGTPAVDHAKAGGGSISQQRTAPVSTTQSGSAFDSRPSLLERPVSFGSETDAEGSAALAGHRAAILQSSYGSAPIEDVLRGLVEVSGGPEVQLLLQALALRKAEALPIVKARLRTGELWEKVILTKFLGHCPWPEAQPELLALVRSRTEHWLARQGAVSTLAAMGDTDAGAEIAAVLGEPKNPVGLQLAAMAATTRIGYRDAISEVRPLARHDDMHIRLFAIRALAEFGEPVDTESIRSALRSGDYVVRVEACEALGALDSAAVVETLQAAAQSDVHEAVRNAAAQALLIRELRGRTEAGKLSVLQRALRGAGRPTALWIVRTMLREGGPEGRALVESLGAQDTWLGERCRAHLILTAGK